MVLSRHDAGVIQVAEYYQNQGYQVRADTDDGHWNKPDLIYGHYPDVTAIRIGPSPSNRNQVVIFEEIIIEVETELSRYGDHSKKQQEAFSRYAQEYEYREFKLVIV